MNILIVVVLITVFLVMALWIKKLMCRQKSDQKKIDYLHGENLRKESAIFDIQKILHIEAGGIYKRISENKEILLHLETDSKILTETNIFWLLDAHHQFLLSLLYTAKEHGLESISCFELYAESHRIDDIEIFEVVGKKLGEVPFVIERLSELKKRTLDANNGKYDCGMTIKSVA